MSPFEKAFAAARKAGKKEFSFNGKKYNTKLKEETASSSSVRPKRNPNRPPSVQSEAPKMGAAPAKAKPVVTKTAGAKATSPRPRARPETTKKGGVSDGNTFFSDFFKRGGLSDRKKK